METVNNLAMILRRNARAYAQWPVEWMGKAHNNTSAIDNNFIALCIDAAQTIAQQLNKQQ